MRCSTIADQMVQWLAVYFLGVVALVITLVGVIVIRNIYLEIKGE